MRQIMAALLLISLAACNAGPNVPASPLQQLAVGLDVTAKTVAELQKTTIDGNAEGLISNDDARTLLDACLKINLAGQQATALVRTLSGLDAPARDQLVLILRPVIMTMDELVKHDLIGIKNEGTKQTVRILLLSCQSTLNTIQIILAVTEE